MGEKGGRPVGMPGQARRRRRRDRQAELEEYVQERVILRKDKVEKEASRETASRTESTRMIASDEEICGKKATMQLVVKKLRRLKANAGCAEMMHVRRWCIHPYGQFGQRCMKVEQIRIEGQRTDWHRTSRQFWQPA
eukprot:6184378-Pleurochrysis_carterae.AAC.4